ncbi:MAG: hypothetical protein IPK80_03735 [Nannocystis sp.]|nr:hypothetical protein [Nannocystis sp.]
MEVSTRPYFKDRTRQHVDINLTHPLDPAKPVRRRVVAPAGMDAAAAVEWGRAEALKLFRALCQPADVRAQKRDATDHDAKPTPPPIKTLTEYWAVFESSHVAELGGPPVEVAARLAIMAIPNCGSRRITVPEAAGAGCWAPCPARGAVGRGAGPLARAAR